MPELPEVESSRVFVLNYCKGKKIIKINLPTGFDEIIMKGCQDKSKLINALKNKILIDIKRKGKQLWFVMKGSETHILCHFGMTGALIVKGGDVPQYKAFKIDKEEWPPKFTKLEIIFDDDTCLAYCDPRRLGKIQIRDNAPNCEPVSKLSLDPYLDSKKTTPDYLYNRLQSFNTSLKAVLLDQEKIVCGVGNWVADEVCYQAGIDPSSNCSAIDEIASINLSNTLRSVINIAVESLNKKHEFPKEWLFHYRWFKGKSSNGTNNKMPDGKTITFATVGGRTTAIVKSKQKLFTSSNSKKKTSPSKKRIAHVDVDVDVDDSEVKNDDDDKANTNTNVTVNVKTKKKRSTNNKKSKT